MGASDNFELDLRVSDRCWKRPSLMALQLLLVDDGVDVELMHSCDDDEVKNDGCCRLL
jgi:hypothetical protein